MNDSHILTEPLDPTMPQPEQHGSAPPPKRSMQSLSKMMVSVAVMLGVVILCGTGLRLSVGLVSDQPLQVVDQNTRQVSHSVAERLSKRDFENEQIREQARRDDRALLQARRDRLWRDESRDRPGKLAGYEKWRKEVVEIEGQLAEAEAIQSKLTPEQALHGPLAQGTVLWHRQQRLQELKSDAPEM